LLAGAWWAARPHNCLNLSHPSERPTVTDRTWLAQQKLEAKIIYYADAGLYYPRWYMHRKTFDRLIERIEAQE